MNVIVMAKGAGLGAWVDEDFAHARQIVLVKDSGGFEARENPLAQGAPDSAALAQFVLRTFPVAHVIVAGAFDDAAASFFAQHGITAIAAARGSVMELAEQARKEADL